MAHPISRRIFLCCLLVAAATATPAAESVPAAPELKLVVADGAVAVFDRSGLLLQSLPFDGEAPDEDNADYFAIAEDMNFDGFPDVRILFSRGIVNVFYDGWIWRPEEKVFVKYAGLRDLSNPVFDRVSHTVRIFERGSAHYYVEGDLAWENGELVWLAKTEYEDAGDDENAVVTRYLRNLAGEMPLLGQTKRPLAEIGAEEADEAGFPPNPPGPNLVVGLRAEPLAVAVLPNGEWWLRQGLPDRTLLIESRRLPAMEYDGEAVRRLIRVEWPRAREIAAAPFPAAAEKTGLPVFKAEFLHGENEDTRQFVAALVLADEWSFWFVLEASADAQLVEDDAAEVDALSQNARLKKDMEALLLGMRAPDPADGDFLPRVGPRVYFAGEDSPLPISVMDALVRIKKIAAPEDSPWVAPGRRAYRYDGPGTAEGAPVLRFSFGADGREKFTAERHFAVDAEGTVYEMDAAAGGGYWKWEEPVPLWWGEYDRGDAVLHIHEYREGPEGMYLTFVFTLGGEPVFDGTAPVRGRTAQYGPLLLSLAPDDGTIAVTAVPDADWEEELPDLTGVYKMQ